MTARMSVIVQPCVNSTWHECMYAARLFVTYVARGGLGGGARPTDRQCSHMEEGMSVCASELIEKREEMGRVRNGTKWKRRERGRGEKGTEREMYSLFSSPPFLHTDYAVWSQLIQLRRSRWLKM